MSARQPDLPALPALRVVRIRNGNEELITLTALEALDALPPLDVPQPTEPMHFGATAKQPAPVRSASGPSQLTNKVCDVLLYLLCLGTLLWVVASAVTQ